MFSQTPFYHSVTRKLVVAIGQLFSGILVERYNSDGVVEQTIEVPVSLSNREKWIQRIEQDPDLANRVLNTYPRIGYEVQGFQYDPSRKVNKVNQLRACRESTFLGDISTAFMPVPYKMIFEVYIISKTQDDGLRIIEQILPFFSPQYVVTLNVNPAMGIVQDIPLTLGSVSVSDTYEGPVELRRDITWTLQFTANIDFMGPITNSPSNVILHTKVKLDPGSGTTARGVDTDVVGTIEDHVIIDSFFDIDRPI